MKSLEIINEILEKNQVNKAINMSRPLLDKIYQEREGEQIDRSMMKDVVQLLIKMRMNSVNAYEKGFEGPLIQETAAFYKRESAKWIEEDSCPDYMKKAEKRLQEEHERAVAYLHKNTEQKLIRVVETELIANHQKSLLEMEHSGFIAQLKNYQVDGYKKNLFFFSILIN